MKKTAMQQLIEQLEEQYKSTPVFGIQYAIRKATELLETEREQIEETYEDALINMGTATCELERAKEYYKETYG